MQGQAWTRSRSAVSLGRVAVGRANKSGWRECGEGGSDGRRKKEGEREREDSEVRVRWREVLRAMAGLGPAILLVAIGWGLQNEV